MLRPAKHISAILAGALAGVLLVFCGLAVRLAQGPIAFNVVIPVVERWLASDVAGGRADVRQADLTWFGPAKALGVRLHGVSLIDGQSRQVLQARQVDVALALPSLVMFSPAPGRIAASDFFAAVSVSPQGKYQLGYDAAGTPAHSGGLLPAFEALTGKSNRNRPLSFLRQIELNRGTVALREVGGTVNWRGQVRQIVFHKAHGRFEGAVDLTAGPQARLTAYASGAVGLKRAFLQTQLVDFDPAKVLPSAGATHRLSSLDALVQGQSTLRWAADQGMQAADIRLTAGEGAMRLNGRPEPFHSAEFRAAYNPAVKRILIQTARVSSSRSDFDVTGQAWLTPESRRTGPARFEIALNSANPRLSLAPGVEPVAMTNAAFRARFIPAYRRFEIDNASAVIDGATLAVSGALLRPRDNRSWGIDVHGRIQGLLAAKTVVALWPDKLNDDVRGWMGDHVKTGRLGDAEFAVRLPMGSVVPHRPMPNDRMHMAFDFQDADVQVDKDMPDVDHAQGNAILQGDRFDLTVTSGLMQNVRLTQGSVRLPKLIGKGKRIEVETQADGDAREILQIVDRVTDGVPTRRGFSPSRVAGRAALHVSVGRPMGEAGPDDYEVAYDGQVKDVSIDNAALGLTLKSASVDLQGALDRVSADGDVHMGPYRGPLQFVADFPRGRPAVQKAQFAGVLDAATFGMSGPSGSTLNFVGRFDSEGQGGKGTISSKAFDGQILWKAGTGGRVQAQGVTNAAALRSVGVPVGKGVPERVPTRLLLGRTASGWAGSVTADAYSGQLVLTDGPSPRLRYVADLTPAESQRIGLPAQMTPGKSTPMLVDVSMTGQTGTAAYTLGSWLGQVNWSPSGAKTAYRWRTVLTADALHAMGLPAGVRPKTPLSVDVQLSDAAGQGFNGTAQVGGGSFKFAAGAPSGGRRKVSITGSIDGASLTNMGLSPPGMISGPAGVSASLELGQDGLRGGHLEADLARAALDAPYVPWTKAAGRPLKLAADFTRRGENAVDLTSLRGQGSGFALAATGAFQPGSGVIRISNAKLDGAFEGSLDLGVDDQGESLTARARYFDARELMGEDGRAAMTRGDRAAGKSMRIDAQFAQVRVGDEAMVHNVRINGDWGQSASRRLDVVLAKADGGALLNLHLYPDAAGTAVNAQVADVSDVAHTIFGVDSFRGGQATINGRLVDGGADLHIEMTKVRLVKAPAVAKILTIGSLHAIADTLGDKGIEFTKVVAPVSIRGAILTVGRARATGPAMGVTTQGIINLDDHTVDLSGGIAPSYVLNSAMGAVPVLGDLLVSHKGEGMFGATYSAKGDYENPKISVNPFSLAAPGILRRIFENRSAAVKEAEGG